MISIFFSCSTMKGVSMVSVFSNDSSTGKGDCWNFTSSFAKNYITMLLVHTYAEISILSCKGFPEKKKSVFYPTRKGRTLSTCIGLIFWFSLSSGLPLWIIQLQRCGPRSGFTR